MKKKIHYVALCQEVKKKKTRMKELHLYQFVLIIAFLSKYFKILWKSLQ